ncbi:hypothetical protein HJFPF1_11443 [Paramyrothecium foliicola]|nr:hypothetical protein HJFPF1_11443 [Paramyrothecium foliicola]
MAKGNKSSKEAEPDETHTIGLNRFNNFSFDIRVARDNEVPQWIRFRVSCWCMRSVCPTWPSIRDNSKQAGICDIQWTDPEAVDAVRMILELIHGKQRAYTYLQNATAARLFYIAELWDLLGRPPHFPLRNKRNKSKQPVNAPPLPFIQPDDIAEAIRKLRQPVVTVSGISDWILLGVVAHRFGLANHLADVRGQLLFHCEKEVGHIAQWAAIKDVRLVDETFASKRLDYLTYIFVSIRLFVKQLEFLDSGLLIGDTFDDRWGQYNLESCPACETPPLGTLLGKLGHHRLWPLLPPNSFEGSINEALELLGTALREVQIVGNAGKKTSGPRCNPLFHMCNTVLRRLNGQWE